MRIDGSAESLLIASGKKINSQILVNILLVMELI